MDLDLDIDIAGDSVRLLVCVVVLQDKLASMSDDETLAVVDITLVIVMDCELDIDDDIIVEGDNKLDALRDVKGDEEYARDAVRDDDILLDMVSEAELDLDDDPVLEWEGKLEAVLDVERDVDDERDNLGDGTTVALGVRLPVADTVCDGNEDIVADGDVEGDTEANVLVTVGNEVVYGDGDVDMVGSVVSDDEVVVVDVLVPEVVAVYEDK